MRKFMTLAVIGLVLSVVLSIFVTKGIMWFVAFLGATFITSGTTLEVFGTSLIFSMMIVYGIIWMIFSHHD